MSSRSWPHQAQIVTTSGREFEPDGVSVHPMNSIRPHLSYANVVATLALLFAMSGGALAANHYLINSTKQINPKVLKKLTGKTGRQGLAGAQGQTGAQGPAGAQGNAGQRGPSDVYEVELSTPAGAPANKSRTLTLTSLPAGTYVISGKADIVPTAQEKSAASCELGAESDLDVGFVGFTGLNGAEERAEIDTMLTHTFPSTGKIAMTCHASSVPWVMTTGRIAATRLDTQHKTTAPATE